MLLQNQGSFPLLQIKVGIFLQFSSRSSQQPLTSNQSSNTSNHTSNLEISNYDSRLSFIAFWVVKFFGDQMRGVLLYFFIVKSHTDNCTHIYTNQYKLITCYTISWPCDLSFLQILYVQRVLYIIVLVELYIFSNCIILVFRACISCKLELYYVWRSTS